MRACGMGCLILLCWTTGSLQIAHAAEKKVLTLEGAARILNAAKGFASTNNWPSVIAIVDDGGWLILLERMDNVPMLASVELAPGKARSAAVFRKPTIELEKAIDGGRAAAITARGYVEMTGGIPILVDGQIVGAIGVSTDTPAHDEAIAEAGVKALESR